MLEDIKDFLRTSEKGVTKDEILLFCEEIRRILIEQDVVEPFVQKICNFIASDTPEQKGTKAEQVAEIEEITRDLISMSLGKTNSDDSILDGSITSFLVIGSQGCGKTSFCAKLANRMGNFVPKDTIVVISLDNKRPAAAKQLYMSCASAGIKCIIKKDEDDFHSFAVKIMSGMKESGKKVLIIDTMGLSVNDKTNIAFLKSIQKDLKISNTLLTIDGMSGRSSLSNIKFLSQAIKSNGIVITKTDDNQNIGTFINSRISTGLPIKYVTTGEKFDDMSTFNRKQYCNKIIGRLDLSSIFNL